MAPLELAVVGLGGLEPPTPRLSSVCSNQLSYRPLVDLNRPTAVAFGFVSIRRTCVGARKGCDACLLKEVIQPQVPLRLPCYDFTPVIDPTVVGGLLAVSQPA